MFRFEASPCPLGPRKLRRSARIGVLLTRRKDRGGASLASFVANVPIRGALLQPSADASKTAPIRSGSAIFFHITARTTAQDDVRKLGEFKSRADKSSRIDPA